MQGQAHLPKSKLAEGYLSVTLLPYQQPNIKELLRFRCNSFFVTKFRPAAGVISRIPCDATT